MEKNIVEIGILLDKDLEKYDKILEEVGAVNVLNVETHDLYFTNKSTKALKMLTENQIKNACVRLRITNSVGGKDFNGDFSINMEFQNFKIFDNSKEDRFVCDMNMIVSIQEQLEKSGWRLVFDTFKRDNHYKIDDMKSVIQIQDIENIGAVLYYDNPDYYGLETKEQREKLIEELNSYGFNFNKETLGIDKLRSLLFGENCFSENQNG